MSARRAAWLAARREIRERVRSRAFRASLAVQVVILVVLVGISAATGGDGPKRYDVAVAGAQARTVGAAATARAAAFDVRITLREEPSEVAARAKVDSQAYDAAIAGDRLFAGPDTADELVAALQAGARAARAEQLLRTSGVPPDRARAILAPPPLAVERIGPAGADAAKAIAYLGTLLLYIAILTFGYTVAAGVVEEKSSRVVELLLATIRPRPLLAGKVLGIGIVGLAQLTIVAGAGLIVASAAGELELPSTTAGTLVLVLVCFVLGYLLYASAFAAAAAMVSRQEDLQSVTGPLVVLLVAGYIASNSAIENASGTFAQVLTFVPPLAPLVVPARAARDALPAWQLGLSLVLMLVFAGLLITLAARIYERGVLRSGAPLKLVQGLRLARRG
jgi:ABC-2 type transport system permease protein